MAENCRSRKHRVLGTVNLDVPFLGVQNRVILTGILSLLKKKPQPTAASTSLSHVSTESQSDTMSVSFYPLSEQTPQTSSSGLLLDTCSTVDDTFDPPFLNDVRIQDRGWGNNVRHFIEKHRVDGLTKATIRHWMAHFEFGSCLLDSSQLKSRYTALRKLEEDQASGSLPDNLCQSTRFVQIYTTCYKSRSCHRRCTTEETTKLGNYGNQQENCFRHRTGRKQGAIFEGGANVDCSERCTGKQLLFCKLAHQHDGKVDSFWKEIVIDAGDEITAHTSLFHPGRHYEALVHQVGDVIAGWVFDIMT